jgi:type VI secretion system protein ImpL
VTSPITLLLESMRDETNLAGLEPRAGGPRDAAPLVGTSGATPASLVAAGLRPYLQLVEVNGSQRPVDQLIAHLGEARTDLSSFASSAAQADETSRKLTLDADRLQSDATTLPQPFRRIAQKIAGDVVAEMGNAAAARTVRLLRDRVTFTCQDLVASKYPFTRDSEREVSLDDFTRLFGPNGLIDKFASDNILPLVDTSGADWHWRGDPPLARQLSATALADFRAAAQIRESFFATEGTSAGFSVSIAPPPGGAARLEVDTAYIGGRRDGGPAVTVSWPGSGDQHRAAVTFAVPGRGLVTTERRGLWALFRLMDTGQMQGDGTAVTFSTEGRTATFGLRSEGAGRPFDLGRLRGFHCPSGA